MTLGFKKAGDLIYLLGTSRTDINSSEYLHKIAGVEFSPCPYFDLNEEYELQRATLNLISEKLIQSAHDVSEGGLFATLSESSFVYDLGFDVASDASIRADAFWFGEAQSRIVVSVSPSDQEIFIETIQKSKVPATCLGVVTKGKIKINEEDWGTSKQWKNLYDNSIADIMKGSAAV
jgi:phosphoribosylformylglycinamidine synthase